LDILEERLRKKMEKKKKEQAQSDPPTAKVDSLTMTAPAVLNEPLQVIAKVE